MAKYVTNSFSLNMLSETNAEISVRPLSLAAAAAMAAGALSIVGHAEIAAVTSSELGVPVAFNRATVALAPGDRLLVAQYRGPRLPEGATTLPGGAAIEYLAVSIHRPCDCDAEFAHSPECAAVAGDLVPA